jgi:hypothetical protein
MPHWLSPQQLFTVALAVAVVLIWALVIYKCSSIRATETGVVQPAKRGGASSHAVAYNHCARRYSPRARERGWPCRGRLAAPPPRSCCAFAPGRRILAHGRVSGKLDALGDESRETLGLGFGEVQVIGDPSLLAGEADGEPTGAWPRTSGQRQLGPRQNCFL